MADGLMGFKTALPTLSGYSIPEERPKFVIEQLSKFQNSTIEAK